jgi:hypothetical protein
MTGDRLAARLRGLSTVAAGTVAAILGALLWTVWQQVASWYIQGSAYTDLPGQNSLRLVHRLEWVVFGVVTLIAGRVAGQLSRTRRWLAAAIGVLPMLLLVLLAVDEGPLIDALPWWSLTYALGVVAAYAPRWSLHRKSQERSLSDGAA